MFQEVASNLTSLLQAAAGGPRIEVETRERLTRAIGVFTPAANAVLPPPDKKPEEAASATESDAAETQGDDKDVEGGAAGDAKSSGRLLPGPGWEIDARCAGQRPPLSLHTSCVVEPFHVCLQQRLSSIILMCL